MAVNGGIEQGPGYAVGGLWRRTFCNSSGRHCLPKHQDRMGRADGLRARQLLTENPPRGAGEVLGWVNASSGRRGPQSAREGDAAGGGGGPGQPTDPPTHNQEKFPQGENSYGHDVGCSFGCGCGCGVAGAWGVDMSRGMAGAPAQATAMDMAGGMPLEVGTAQRWRRGQVGAMQWRVRAVSLVRRVGAVAWPPCGRTGCLRAPLSRGEVHV